MFHKNKKRDTFSDPNARKMYLIIMLNFLFGLSSALLLYVLSSYFQAAIGSDRVGPFYVIASLAILFALLNLHKVFSAFGRGRTLVTALFLQVGALFILTVTDISLYGAFFAMVYFVLFGVIYVLLDVVLEAYSEDGETGRIRGLFLSTSSIGWLVGPLFSTTMIERFGFHALFFIVMLIYMILFVVAFLALNDIRGHNRKQPAPIRDTVQTLYKRKGLWYVFVIATGLRFFYAVMTIFIPLYLLSLGFVWQEIGLMFTIMLVPFVLLSYPAGFLADKRWGEKEILFFGVVIIVVAVGLIQIVHTSDFWLWTGILVLSRVGCALIEAMRDTYFYKHVDAQDTALMNFFRTARPVGFLLATSAATVVQVFFDTRAIFAVLLGVFIVMLYPVLRLPDTQPQRDML